MCGIYLPDYASDANAFDSGQVGPKVSADRVAAPNRTIKPH